MATLVEQLKTYLGASAAQYTDAVLLGVINTESAAQQKVVQPVYLVEYDVIEALMRRCQRNLAMRALPIGLTDAGGDTGARSYVPGRDPEIRRLEAPYRKIVIG